MILVSNVMIANKIIPALFAKTVLKTRIMQGIGMFYNRALLAVVIVETQKLGK